LKNSQLTCGETYTYLGDRALGPTEAPESNGKHGKKSLWHGQSERILSIERPLEVGLGSKDLLKRIMSTSEVHPEVGVDIYWRTQND
jgi:hypothetical protein